MQEKATQLQLQDNGTISAEHTNCLDCRRRLKTTTSRANGRGPVCQRKHTALQAFAAEAGREKIRAEGEFA